EEGHGAGDHLEDVAPVLGAHDGGGHLEDHVVAHQSAGHLTHPGGGVVVVDRDRVGPLDVDLSAHVVGGGVGGGDPLDLAEDQRPGPLAGGADRADELGRLGDHVV